MSDAANNAPGEPDGAPEPAADAAQRRMELALSLGRRDLRLFSRAQDLSLPEARRRLQRQRQLGRRPSACMDDAEPT